MNYDLIGFSLWIDQINKCRIPKSRKMLFYPLSKQVDQARSCIFNTNIYNEGSVPEGAISMYNIYEIAPSGTCPWYPLCILCSFVSCVIYFIYRYLYCGVVVNDKIQLELQFNKYFWLLTPQALFCTKD